MWTSPFKHSIRENDERPVLIMLDNEFAKTFGILERADLLQLDTSGLHSMLMKKLLTKAWGQMHYYIEFYVGNVESREKGYYIGFV